MASKILLLTSKTYDRLTRIVFGSQSSIKCHGCEKEFKKPVKPYKILSRKMTHKTTWYHLKCAKRYNLI